MSVCVIGVVESLLQRVSSFVANLNSFTHSNQNYKGMQKGVFGLCVVKDAPHITQYKVIHL
jgi:hypothetical protein